MRPPLVTHHGQRVRKVVKSPPQIQLLNGQQSIWDSGHVRTAEGEPPGAASRRGSSRRATFSFSVRSSAR
jgi:hypothetical protein